MFPIGQRVDHRDRGVSRKLFELIMGENPGDDTVHVAGQHPGHVRCWLPGPQADFFRAEVDRVPAHLINAHLEAGARAKGGLLEKES